jgi:dipeptide/tripeptide permease
MKKGLRNTTIFLAIMSLLFLLVSTWLPIDMAEWDEFATLLSGVLLALGILVDTGDNPQPITWERIKEKIKSPVAVTSLFALFAFIFYKILEPDQADTILQILETILVSVFGFSVYNNPNDRNNVRLKRG